MAPSQHDKPVRHEIHDAGPCYSVAGPTVQVRLEGDGPLRDCLVVRPGQRLTVTNATSDNHFTGESIGVNWDSRSVRGLEPGNSAHLGRIGAGLGEGFHPVELLTHSGVRHVALYVCPGTVVFRPLLACVDSN